MYHTQYNVLFLCINVLKSSLTLLNLLCYQNYVEAALKRLIYSLLQQGIVECVIDVKTCS